MLDGDLAAVFGSIMGAYFLDATLHRQTVTDDGMGGGSASSSDEAVKAQLDQTTQRQQSEGYTDKDQRILVIASGVEQITTDDEITVAGARWAIASVTQDPARSYYDLRGRLSGYVATPSEPVELTAAGVLLLLLEEI